MQIHGKHLPIWRYILTTGSEAQGDQTFALICIRCYIATHESRRCEGNGPGWIVAPSQNYAGRRFDGNFTVKHFFSCKRRGARRSACVSIGRDVEWSGPRVRQGFVEVWRRLFVPCGLPIPGELRLLNGLINIRWANAAGIVYYCSSTLETLERENSPQRRSYTRGTQKYNVILVGLRAMSTKITRGPM